MVSDYLWSKNIQLDLYAWSGNEGTLVGGYIEDDGIDTVFRGACGGQFSYDGASCGDISFLDGGEVLSFGTAFFFLL